MAYLNPAAGAAREVRSSAGAPVAGTNEIQTVTLAGTPTGGTFTLAFRGFTTAPIAWSNVNATLLAAVKTALEALPSIGFGGLTVAAGTLTAGIGTIIVTFSGGNVQKRAVPTITVGSNALTGTNPTVAVAETTAGVDASGVGASKGATLIRTDTGVRYYNAGTAQAPSWTAM